MTQLEKGHYRSAVKGHASEELSEHYGGTWVDSKGELRANDYLYCSDMRGRARFQALMPLLIPEQVRARDQWDADVKDVLRALTPTERWLVERTTGLWAGMHCTLADAAVEVEVAPEHIEQVWAQAMRKLARGAALYDWSTK